MDGKFLSWWGKGWQNFRLEMMWEVFDILFHVIYSKNMDNNEIYAYFSFGGEMDRKFLSWWGKGW